MKNNKQNFHQAATGNAGATSLDWPAKRPECTARGATNATNSKPIRASSNTGPEMIDHGYVSDGQNVWAMQANGSYASVNGTSFSTPLGSGIVANIVAQDTTRNNTQVRAVLDDGGRDLGAVGPDNIYGKGWVELDRGLKKQVVKHVPNSFDANTTPSYNFIPKYYNGLLTTNEKLFINGSTTGMSPTVINGMNEAEFNLIFTSTNGFVNGANTIRYEFNTPDGCLTKISKTFTVTLSSSIIYTFIGNGNWNNAANWSNNTIPPANLPNGSQIVIDPVVGGECLLNISQTIAPGGKLTVNPNKKFTVPGNLIIQ